MEVGASSLLYELLAEIGQGSFGKVYKARAVGEGGRLLAVKKFHFCSQSSADDNGIPSYILREVALLDRMKYFQHSNVVKLLDVTATLAGNVLDLTLVLEYIDQDLSTYLSKAPPSGLGRDNIRLLMLQVMRGLDFLHVNMVLHRDLKPANILVSSCGLVKIADFGMSRLYTFNTALSPNVVTLWYRAPELLLKSSYMTSVDVWSAGCVFAELFLLKPLFDGISEAQQLRMIFEFIGLPSQDEWPESSPVSYSLHFGPKNPSPRLLFRMDPYGRDLLLQCLTFAPSRRISAAAALAHPFFNQH
ncbi:cyclin-dependent kinase 4 [Syngnathus typhle]|uniref:cyclin-dependent kinase 4 n=1 Tax=Syngnathus typhle TaxID=161592 RepID=UPI002A69DB84|nr:cyclin-dependent kinase 4 [Syngnathus typhle]XP_061159915.1 cyclin-dependent kinase 4 [Syngnathus typhle]